MTSSSSPTQQQRRVAIETVLGEDVLLFSKMTVTEHISRISQMEVEVLSLDREIDPNAILGTNVTVRLQTHKDGTRHFNGFVTRFSHAGRDDRFTRYHMSMRSWLWFLTRTADCRIFQNKKVPEIIAKVFSDLEFSDYDMSGVKGTHPVWEYSVQYRETDFNYVSRLMEQEGMYYWIKHENGKHTVMIADDSSAHSLVENYEKVYFWTEGGDQGDQIVDHVTDWYWSKEVQPGKYAAQDYNFETPSTNLMSNDVIPANHAHDKYEIYDFPGEFKDTDEGTETVKYRMEELHAQHETVRGSATARGLQVGGLFKLEGYWRSDQNQEYLLTSTTIEIVSDEYVASGAGGDSRLYTMTFTAIPSSVQYRAMRITPKPLVQGPQTAKVVGPEGDEIHTDQFGRIKVQFHWDREGQADENSSCWIRCMQSWAGKSWGFQHIPRIGHEVVVEFLEGDPDRPFCSGSLYHAENMPPFDLPDNKTISGLKTNSSKGGQGFNQISFEDLKGEEKIFVHAEKDLHQRVKHDRLEIIKNDRHLIVDNDKFEHIKNNRHEIVDADHNEHVKGNRSRKVDGAEKVEIGGKKSEKIGGAYALEVGKGTPPADLSIDVGKDINIKAAQNLNIDCDMADMTTNIAVGSQTTEAAIAIELKVGASKILIEQSGITIEAPMITITGTATAEMSAPSTTVSGTGSLALKGAMVAIN